jgi:hypothetical protein
MQSIVFYQFGSGIYEKEGENSTLKGKDVGFSLVTHNYASIFHLYQFNAFNHFTNGLIVVVNNGKGFVSCRWGSHSGKH